MRTAFALPAIGLIAFCPVSLAGKVVVSGDDQTFRPAGFVAPNDGVQFAQNVATFFTGGESGNFLVYSDNPALTGSELQAAMQAAGHTWTISTSVTFDLPTLLAYDAVFVGGSNADVNVLVQYVSTGGNVYLAAGTGPDGFFGDYATEAAIWNGFLQSEGLSLAFSENGECGDLSVSGDHPLLAGVDSLAQCHGQDIEELDPGASDPDTEIILFRTGTTGYFAVSISSSHPPILNDECSSATQIFPGGTPFSTIGATTGGPFEDFPCAGGGSDIWFRYTAPCSASTQISTCGSALDTLIFVYETCPEEAGQFIRCNDDSCGQQSRTDFFTSAGQTYYIRVGGFEGSQGTGVLTLEVNGASVIGDINSDGVVNLADLAILLSHFGSSGVGYADGDVDRDGDVDLADLALMLSHFGESCG
jgi:hypothetical protein